MEQASLKNCNMNKKRITLADFDFGKYPKEEPIVLEGEDLLRKAWKGLTPREVAREMASEYLRRFPQPIMPKSMAIQNEEQEDVWRRWITPRENTCGELEKSLKQAARLCVGHGDHLTYWDCMRSLFRHLPNTSTSKGYRRIKKTTDSEKEKQNVIIKKEKAKNDGSKLNCEFDVCRLCWRAVQTRKGEAFCYCHITSCDKKDQTTTEHNSRRRKSDSKKIRPYSTLLPTDMYSRYWNICWPGFKTYEVYVTSNALGIPEQRRRITTFEKVWLQDPTYILKRLPHVLQYLTDLNVNIHSTEHIIEALEHPRPPVGNKEEELARTRFLYNCCEFYHMYVPHLIWAEIWLRYEAEQKARGGARKGAGRPRKTTTESSSAQTDNDETEGCSS